MSSQVIVKFRDERLDPSRAAFVRTMSGQVGAELVYLRPMSGNAHVFTVHGVSDNAALEQVVKQLSARPDVEYAEINARMRHHEKVR